MAANDPKDVKPEPLHNDPAKDQPDPGAAPDQSFSEAQPKAGTAEAEPAAEEGAEKKPARSKASDKRQEVLERIKAKQAEERPKEGDGFSGVAPVTATAEEPASDAPVAEQPVAEKPKRKLKVDRREIEVTDEEMAALAQQGLAVGNRLAELNELTRDQRSAIAELRQTRNNADRSAPPAQPQEARAAEESRQPPTRATGKIDKERLLDLVEKIRVGDGDEGVEELSSLLGDLAQQPQEQQPNASPDEIAATVERRLRAAAALEATNREFAGRHPEIASDEDLGAMTARRVVGLVLEEMHQLGVPAEALRAAAQNPFQAADWHRQYREQGHPVSSPQELADRAAGEVEARFNLKKPEAPAPQTGPTRAEARTQEKRTDLQNQPRRASGVARQAPVQAKTTTDVVNDMKARRGFRATV